MSYLVILGRNWIPNVESWAVTTGGSGGPFSVHAVCPTREAAEAARRLLSGECAQELADAQMDRLVAAKTGPGKPMRDQRTTRECERRYNEGRDDGAAQERARIVAFVRKRHRGTGLADLIERGEAGE